MNSRPDCLWHRVVHACALFLLLSFFVLPAAAQQPEMAKAEALLKAGKPAEAYALLAPLEDKYAGNVDFDYLLGITALDSGKADRATLAFERVLAVNPAFAGARLDLARAYYQLGDTGRAKAEFQTVLSQNPPEAARRTIARYLEEIEKREKGALTILRGYVEGTLGYDTNVNNATNLSTVAVPGLGNLRFTLDPSGVKQSDWYYSLGAGVEIAHQITPNLAVFGAVDGRHRSNFDVRNFDFQSLDGRIGATYGAGNNLFRFTYGLGDYYFDYSRNRDTTLYSADWRYIVNPSHNLNVFGQHTRFRFTGDLSVNDFDQTILGAGWTALFHGGKSALVLAGFGGEERDTGSRADGGKDILGGRIAGQLSLRDNLDLLGAVSAQQGDYNRLNAAFQTTREDKQFDAVVGLQWRFRDAWTLRPQLLYIRNKSNISIYTYDRYDASITLRRDFY